MKDKTIPRLHAYDSALLENLWMLWRKVKYAGYREVKARMLFLIGRGSYKNFMFYRNWALKFRRSRMAP